jgi:iron complex outermembrane receptor protein
MRFGRAGFCRALLLGGAALISGAVAPTAAFAQEPSAEEVGLDEIVVTAQKREQSMQDVPIAVTALTADTLQANRVTSVSDLSGLAPGVIVRTAAGGSQLPSFSIRGVVSYGVVPGSDKQVSMYIDGVYLGAARGAIFDLPDIQRIEILRGPQGTLFGRNATAGAVSITTRDPSGEAGVKASVTVGNYDHFRGRVSLDLPQIGPFSAYVTYVHNYKRGDIRNAGAGQLWDRSAGGKGTARSVEWLGTKNSHSVFAAVKFEPSDTFRNVYKFDYSRETGSPDGTGFVGIHTPADVFGLLVSPVALTLINSQPVGTVFTAPDGKRPEIVNNSWVIPLDQTTYGHSLTSTLDLTDNLSVKNILAYRYSHIFATSALDGISGLPLTAATVPVLAAEMSLFTGRPFATIQAELTARIGQPTVLLGNQAESFSKQWSDELQINYNSSLLTLTAGGIWFHSDERAGAEGLPGAVSFANPVVQNGVIVGRQAVNYNKATSLAAYAQVELHVTPQLDLVGGARITWDRKSGRLVTGLAPALSTIGVFEYSKTKPNFLVGVNYRPTEDIMLYGKFSTAFVSGGSVSGLEFQPETATSWEAGLKADLIDRRLRTNLALYHVTYKNFQTSQSGSNFPFLFPSPPFPPGFANAVGTIIVSQGGPVRAKGFELEVTAAPVRGLTTGGSLSFTDTTFEAVNPVLIAGNRGDYQPALRAKWTGGLWGQYESEPLFDDATLLLRMDGQWHSRFFAVQNRIEIAPAFTGIRSVAPSWMINGRAALRNITLGGAKLEVAAWVKNLTQNRELTFALAQNGVFGSANYVPARTFGLDLNVEF